MDFGVSNTVRSHLDKPILDVIQTTVTASGRLTTGQ
jgi:hypothetical protein